MSSVIRGRQQLHNDGLSSIVIAVPRSASKDEERPLGYEPDASPEERTLQAERHAETLIETAKREAERILAEASKEAADIRVKAQADGFEQGQREAAEELSRRQASLEATHRQAMQETTTLAEAIQAQREQLVMGAMEPLPGICLEVLRDVLGRELQLSPANIEGLVQDVIQYVVDATRMEVRVNPADYALAQAAHPTWRGAKYGEWELVVVPDVAVLSGGFQLRSDVGNIDATVEVKLEMLQEAIDRAFAGGEVEQVGSFSDVTSMG